MASAFGVGDELLHQGAGGFRDGGDEPRAGGLNRLLHFLRRTQKLANLRPTGLPIRDANGGIVEARASGINKYPPFANQSANGFSFVPIVPDTGIPHARQGVGCGGPIPHFAPNRKL